MQGGGNVHHGITGPLQVHPERHHFDAAVALVLVPVAEVTLAEVIGTRWDGTNWSMTGFCVLRSERGGSGISGLLRVLAVRSIRKAAQQNLFHLVVVLGNGGCIPLRRLHHEILFHAVDGVISVVLPLCLWHEVAEPRVLAMADQAEVTERVERLGWQGIMPRQGVLWIVMLYRAAECELIGFYNRGVPVLQPKKIVEVVKD